MTKGLLDNMNQDNFSLNFNDVITLESMRHTNNSLIDAKAFFSGKDSSGQQMLVPLIFLFDTNTDPFWVNVSFTNPSNGKSYTFNIDSNDDGSDYWASKVTEVSVGEGGDYKIYSPTYSHNASTGKAVCNFSNDFVLKNSEMAYLIGNIDYFVNTTRYTCYVSIPFNEASYALPYSLAFSESTVNGSYNNPYVVGINITNYSRQFIFHIKGLNVTEINASIKIIKL